MIEKNEEINNAIERDIRKSVVNNFDRETISNQNIQFLNVADIVTYEIIAVDITDKINKVTNNVANETNKVFNAIVIDFFVCFVRTCSCNLILFKNLTKQRLHENVSIFFFVIRCFLTCCCFN